MEGKVREAKYIQQCWNENRRLQAIHLRIEDGITTLDKAIAYFEGWVGTQEVIGGVMDGMIISKRVMIALLSVAIEPEYIEEVSMSSTSRGDEIYCNLFDKGLI